MNRKKKGSIDDIFFILVLGFVMSIVVITTYVFFSKFNENVQASGTLSTEGKSIISTNLGRYVALFDNGFLVVVIAMVIASLLMASQIDTAPAFMIGAIIIYIVVILLSAILGNTFYSIMASESLKTYADAFTIIPFIYTHLVQFMLAYAFMIVVVLYAKTQ